MSDYRIEAASKEEWAERALRAEAKLEKAIALVKIAFSEGFCEGTNDVLRQSGGNTWYDSKSRKLVEEMKGEKQ